MCFRFVVRVRCELQGFRVFYWRIILVPFEGGSEVSWMVQVGTNIVVYLPMPTLAYLSSSLLMEKPCRETSCWNPPCRRLWVLNSVRHAATQLF